MKRQRKILPQKTTANENKTLTMPPWGVVFFLAAFIFYLVTLAPGVLDHDGAQFQTLGYTGGVAHPTGYPLYIMILRTFVCCLPIGDVAFRVNLVSAVFASLTVMLVYYFCFLTLRNHLASLVAAISLGVSSTFWIYGITAEVYSLHLFFMMCILVVLLWWKQTQKPQLLWLLSFLLGVSFSHHRMTLLLIPSVLYFVLAYWKKENRVNLLRMSLVVAILFIVGLSVYLYSYHQISIDNPANEYQVLTQYLPQLGITEADWNSTWKKFLCLISTGRYKWDILVFTTPRFVENLAAVVPNLLHQFALGVVVGMVGLIISFLKDRRLAWFLFSLFGIHILFALVVHGEFQVWLLPGNVLFAMWIGFGFLKLWEAIQSNVLTKKKKLVIITQALIALALPASIIFYSWGGCFLQKSSTFPFIRITEYQRADSKFPDLRNFCQNREMVGKSIIPLVDKNAVVYAHWKDLTTLRYFAYVVYHRLDIHFKEFDIRMPEELNIRSIDNDLQTRPVRLFLRVGGTPKWIWERYDCCKISEVPSQNDLGIQKHQVHYLSVLGFAQEVKLSSVSSPPRINLSIGN